MPFVHAAGARIHYRLEGHAPKPLLVLSHSLGCDHGMWDPQMPALLERFRVLRYDTRGHGASDAPPGDYTIELLARDVLALADATGTAHFHFCGLSLGGMTGQWLGANAPSRVNKLVLANTSAKFADPSLMETRRRTVLERGMAAIRESVLSRFFSAASRARPCATAATIEAVLLATNPVGYAGCCAAVRDLDNRAFLGAIQAPTLVIASQTDLSTPWTGHGDHLTAAIPNARHVLLPTAHLSNVERPHSFTAALVEFLAEPAGPAYEAGMEVRRQMLGDAHVDRSIANATPLTRDFQQLITTTVWGAIWTRPGLDARTRRLLVLAITAAQGRWEEFRLHVRTGLQRELEPCDLEEVLLQVAAYAGVPAANTAFHIAVEEQAATEP